MFQLKPSENWTGKTQLTWQVKPVTSLKTGLN